jgi:outer membrane protein TolC
MKQMSFLCSTLLLFMLPLSVSAQKMELSLHQSIQIALKQNLQYQSSEKSLDIARSRMYESIGNFLPTIDATLIRNVKEKLMEIDMPPLSPGMPPTKITIDFTKDYQAALKLRQPIFTGGAIWNNYRQNHYNYKAMEQNYRKEKLSTIFQVKQAYYNVLLTEELVKVAEEAMKLRTDLYENTKLLYEQGMTSKFQLLNAEVEMENVKPRLIESRNNTKLAVLAFKNILQLEVDKFIEFTRNLEFVEREFSIDTLLQLAHRIRPDILQIEYQSERMDNLVYMSYASFSPILALAADYGYRRDSFTWDINKWEDNYSINLVLSVPLFQGTQRVFKIQQAKSTRDQVELAVIAVKTGADLEIKKNYLKFHVAIEKLNSQEKNVSRAEENVHIADLNYKEGLVTPLEMSVAQMNLIETRILYIRSLYEYLISLAALEKSVGIENMN